ncbi:MAG: RNA-binding protein [Candidatus Altiarchaeales archaeon ex4484_96]|nr:MAG: RNA-binding protein [Candidatus Altiarchaeales archaeon ex4484_96]
MAETKDKAGKKCTSCEKEVDERYTEFKCPKCGKETIVRCSSCRVLGVNYTCSACGFTGP